MTSPRDRLVEIQRACPPGHEVHLVRVYNVEHIHAGDVVLTTTPANGSRGGARVKAFVTVARIEPITEAAS